ncbi:peptidoglycan DD-metalloendopeptidase family protein [Gracilibacillus sp. YIM 98692]|uniref:peptidoglycan DD-metalloendopeptidase family protein n=1 Tax=Gracilibacillus sp. YIM 98692 TaxID=2663532 RepID=UPI0013D6899C|nr:peptidoglycan DD-metalloendopeptidase family protein [Gracilibacillus sp. YIM 98692]
MPLPSPNQQQEPKNRSVVKDVAKHQVKKQGKKLAKKALKKGAKLAAKAAAKGVTVLLKVLAVGVSSIGVPTLLIAAGVIVLVIILSLLFTFFFSFGDEEMTEDERSIQKYIEEKANSTVNMNNSFEKQYRVPNELIASVIQIESMQEGVDVYDVIDQMSTSLAPEFMYDEFNEWTETKTQVCRDGDCEPYSEPVREDNWVSKVTSVDYWNGSKHFTYTPYTTNWEIEETVDYETESYEVEVPIKRTETIEIPFTNYRDIEYEVTVREKRTRWVTEERERIKFIPQWPFIITETYEVQVEETYYVDVPKTVCCMKVPFMDYREEEITLHDTVTEERTREIEVIIRTATRHQRFEVDTEEREDYTTLDNILNSIGYSKTDKMLVDANFAFVDGESNYTNWLVQNDPAFRNNFSGFQGIIQPGEGIVPEFMTFYREAEAKYGVDWYVLASVHFQETRFNSIDSMISWAGAIGPMQFLPATWSGWKYDVGGGLVDTYTIDITDPTVISNGGGYGVDANGDGIADPWDTEDAIHTAANYLASSGYNEDPRKAIFNYNHANWYVNEVLERAERYKNQATYLPDMDDVPPVSDGAFMRPATGSVTSTFGYRAFNGGSFHNGIDIGKNGRSHDVPIVASASGVVRLSDRSSSYGNWVIITHQIEGTTFETVYAHMKNRAVNVGDTVSKGEFLGYMGNTGKSFGAHLHFEVHSPSWNNAKSNKMDPILYVPF